MNFEKKGFFSTRSKQAIPLDLFLEKVTINNNYFQQSECHSKFIANHALELLDIALNEDNLFKSIKNKTALFLLSNSPKNVMDELLIDGRFLIKSTNILSKNYSYFIAKELASRISLIFINIIIKTNDRDIIIDSIGFLTQIIQYIEEESVLNFFLLIASNNDDYKEMQIYLSQVNLYQFLLNELPNENENNFEKERNILIFIRDCLRNPILQKSFQKEEILIKIFERLEKRKNFILNSTKQEINYGDIQLEIINRIYEVLSLLVCQNLVIKMKSLLTFSIENVKSFSESIQKYVNSNSKNIDYCSHLLIKKYHAYMFDLISKIVVLNPKMFDSNDHSILIKSIERVIQVFPNSTNLIISAFRVVKSSVICKCFAKKMVDSLMPIFISLAKSKTRTASAAAATHFLADMDMTKNSSKMISEFLTKNDQYMSFYKMSFKNYLEKAYVPYGGPVTVFRNKNIKIIRIHKSKINMCSKESIEA